MNKKIKEKIKSLNRLAGCIKLLGKPKDYGFKIIKGYIIIE